MKSKIPFRSVVYLFLLFPIHVCAEVWTSSCAKAIDDLRKIQQEVSAVYEKYDSAKFNLEVEKRMLDLCLGDCRREQEAVNRRGRDYNEGVKELKKNLSDFESALHSFQKQCLQGKPSG
jgi:septal ring factor EnvC (AmiA/AmiB activator)